MNYLTPWRKSSEFLLPDVHLNDYQLTCRIIATTGSGGIFNPAVPVHGCDSWGYIPQRSAVLLRRLEVPLLDTI